MRIRVSLVGSTAEATSCVSQALDAISMELEALDSNAPPFSLIDTLRIGLSIAHPSGGEGGWRGSGRFNSATLTFHAQAALTYEPWLSSNWADRLAGAGDGMQRALNAVHKTRITEAERKAAGNIIQAAVEAVACKPPSLLVDLLPIYLAYSQDGGERPWISFGRPHLTSDPSHRIVVVPPSEATAYAYLRERRDDAPEMFKLYRRSDGVLEYWEAWPTEFGITEHRGVCGERGTTREIIASGATEQKAALKRMKAEAHRAGFKTIPMSRHAGLLVEIGIDGFGSEADLDKRHALEEFLNELMGWLGLGHCDGGSTGSGTMEAFCLVVDYNTAAKAIEAALAASPFAGYRVRRQD